MELNTEHLSVAGLRITEDLRLARHRSVPLLRHMIAQRLEWMFGCECVVQRVLLCGETIGIEAYFANRLVRFLVADPGTDPSLPLVNVRPGSLRKMRN